MTVLLFQTMNENWTIFTPTGSFKYTDFDKALQFAVGYAGNEYELKLDNCAVLELAARYLKPQGIKNEKHENHA